MKMLYFPSKVSPYYPLGLRGTEDKVVECFGRYGLRIDRLELTYAERRSLNRVTVGRPALVRFEFEKKSAGRLTNKALKFELNIAGHARGRQLKGDDVSSVNPSVN